MNYYEHHIRDYDADTAHLSWLEDMAYTRLLRLYYRKEAPISADIAQVCRLVRAHSKAEKKAVEQVLREFFELRDDGWHHDRCDEEIASYQARAERSRACGKLGGRPSRQTDADAAAGKPTGVTEQAHGEPTGNPAGFSEKPSENPAGFQKKPGRNLHQTPDTSKDNLSPQPLSGLAPPLQTAENPPGSAPQTQPEPTPATADKPGRFAEQNPRGTRLPPDWTPPAEWLAWAQQARPDLDVSEVAERFRDFWVAKPGKDGRKADWAATWRNWVRNESPPRTGIAAAPRITESFAERETRHKRQLWEQMTGRKWPGSDQDVIEAACRDLGSHHFLEAAA